MLSRRPRSIRYAFALSCFVALISAQLPGLVSRMVDANSSEGLLTAAASDFSPTVALNGAAVPYAPFNQLCVPGTLDNATDLTFNRPSTLGFSTSCNLTGAFTLYDAYTFNVSGCTNPSVTVSTCTGSCGTQGTLDTILYVYQKAGGASATQASPIFAPSSPCTNGKAANNDACGVASQLTATLQTTSSSGDFVVVVAANSPFNAGAPSTFGPYNLRVDAPACTVTQIQSCIYAINPVSQSFLASGGTGSVTVNSDPGCPWTAVSNDSFITINSGASGTGTGTVGYTVAANSGAARVGTMTIAGQSFTVTQEAGAVALPCIRDALVTGDPTFIRPSLLTNPPTCPGSGRPTVFYKAYEFNIAGCASATVNANTCNTGGCTGSGPVTLADTVLFIYRKSTGAPSIPGNPIFNPVSPCTNVISGNNDSCGTFSSLTNLLGAGNFVVVVASNGAGQTGTFNLSVTAPGCTLTFVQPCSTITGTVSGGGTICSGGTSSITVTVSGGVPPYTVTLNNGGGTQTGLSPLTFSVSPAATTTYSVASGTDAAGCPISGSGSATVTVSDTQAPTVTCPAPTTVSAGSNCQAAVPNVLGGVTVSDNCTSSGSITLSQSPAAGTMVGLGPHTITVTATDGSNNSSQCTTTVTVADTTPPVITTCASNKTITAGASCQAALPNLTGEVIASDSCSPPVTISQSPAAGTMVGIGNTTVTLIATDASNNQSTCAATVTVVDTTPPTVTCPAGTTGSADANCQAAVPNVTGNVTASDNCTPTGSLNITQDPAAGTLVGLGVTTITVTVKDASDNVSTCTTTFTVNDTTPPSISCPANIARNNDPNQCSAVVSFQPTASDNCTGVTTSCSPASGSAFPVGTTTVTCTATDAAGNHTSCGFTVTVNDTQAPTITCPANITQGTDPNQPTAVVTYQASVSDNCPGATYSCSPPSGSTFSLGTTTVTCTATDASNNHASCSFTVTVVDTQPPSITCPTNQSRANDPNQCGANVTYPNPTVTDNTPGPTFTCSPQSGTFFQVGVTMVTCTATDSAGNHSNCSFTVTVNDTQPPVISCPGNVSSDGNIFGSCSANVSTGTATATDNCPGVTVTGVRSDGMPLNAPYPQGTTTITWTARDASNNTASCQQTVTVTNPAPVVTITGPPSGSIYPVGTSVSFTATFTDNLGGTHTGTWMFDTISQGATIVEPTSSTPGSANTSFTFTTAGVYSVKLTVNDGCGGVTTADTVNGVPALVVIFDSNGAFVTGGGWIDSPTGAYVANPSIIGKGNFGLNAKYHNGATIPTGETEFNLNAANFKFHSTAYEWLVVTGPKAQYQGSGTVNGGGNYGFKVTVIDGQEPGGGGVDRFRIKIWNKNAGNAVVYDNEMNVPDSTDPTTPLGGGSIVIH